MNKPPAGISGRWFTICFGILLVLGVIVGFASVVRFQRTLDALDNVRSFWPEAASVLEERYQAFDGMLVKIDDADSDGLKQPMAEWREARILFRSSTQYDVQSPAVRTLEALVEKLNLTKDGESLPKASSASLEKFLQADRTLGSLQSDIVGKLCKLLFRLNIPTSIYSVLE